MPTGGVASVIYGDSRFTRDIDVVLSVTGSDVDQFSLQKLEYFRESGSDRHLHDVALMHQISRGVGGSAQFGAAAPSPAPYPSISMTFTIS